MRRFEQSGEAQFVCRLCAQIDHSNCAECEGGTYFTLRNVKFEKQTSLINISNLFAFLRFQWSESYWYLWESHDSGFPSPFLSLFFSFSFIFHFYFPFLNFLFSYFNNSFLMLEVHEGALLQCDGCDRAFHCKCANPPLLDGFPATNFWLWY